MSLALDEGDYCIEIEGRVFSSLERYHVVVSFVPGDVDDYGETCETAIDVPTISTTLGALETIGDTDAFRLNLTESGRLTLTTTGTTATSGALRDAAGMLVAEDDQRGLGANFDITSFLDAGSYCVEVRGGRPLEVGRYVVISTFEPGATDDHGDTCDTATRLTPNTSAAGTLETKGDTDFFRVTTPAVGRLTVLTTGRADTSGTVQDETGLVLAQDNRDNFGGNFVIPALFLFAGDYCIAVRGQVTGLGDRAIGRYRLVLDLEEEF